MNNLGNNNIPSSKKDDDLLTRVTRDVERAIKDKYLFVIPDTWNFECGSKSISFEMIKENLIAKDFPIEKCEEYYGLPTSIVTDANIIYLTIVNDDKIMKKPIFIGEIKKQGTNDKRLMEGKTLQAIGNAACDRIYKNWFIAGDFCRTCDKKFFPYNVFLHGCDFGDNMTTTMKGKVQPIFGKLNNLSPFFDMFLGRRGGSCFHQVEDYTYEQLYDICYKCCEIGIEHYLAKYGLKK